MTRAVMLLCHPQRGQPLVAGNDLSVDGEIRRAVLQADHDRLVRREALYERGKLTIEEEPAVMDDQHAAAQRLDVGHVVAGEEDGRTDTACCIPQGMPGSCAAW